MNAIWEVAISIAGIGAVASLVLWLVYRQWLQLPIFQVMTKEQQYRLFRLVILLTFVFAVIGLITYGYVSVARGNKEQSTDDAHPKFKDKPIDVEIKKVDPIKDAARVPPDEPDK